MIYTNALFFFEFVVYILYECNKKDFALLIGWLTNNDQCYRICHLFLL